MQIRLTDTFLTSTKQGEFWDTLLPSFGVRKGKRRTTFVVNHGNRRKKIGTYPQVSLKDARRRANEIIDGDATESATVSSAVRMFLSMVEVKPRTLYDYTRLLNRHLVTHLGSRDIRTVSPKDIIGITDAVLSTPSEARHAHVVMKLFFNWARRRSLIEGSPMAILEPPTKHRTRSRVLTEGEIKAVWKASDQLGAFGNLVKLLFLTGARRSEIPACKTLAEGTVTFLNTKNGRDHILPITPYMWSLFTEDYTNYGWSKNKARLDKLSGVSGYVLHDIRRTSASNMAGLNIDPFIIERILNHTLPKVQGIYNRHNYTEAMREPLERHERWLRELVGASESSGGQRAV